MSHPMRRPFDDEVRDPFEDDDLRDPWADEVEEVAKDEPVQPNPKPGKRGH